jgi:hypothetical protein
LISIRGSKMREKSARIADTLRLHWQSQVQVNRELS